MKTASMMLLAALAAASGKPRVEFKPLQRMTNLPVGRCEATVVFKLTVEDGGSEDYYCPKVVWEWEDGTQSSEESDCVPFDQAAREDHKRTWTKSHSFHTTGSHPIRVTLCRASRKIRTLGTTATVSGWEGCPEYQPRGGMNASGDSGSEGSDDSMLSSPGAPRQSSKDPCAERE